MNTYFLMCFCQRNLVKIQNWLYPKMIFIQQIQINNVIFGFRFDTPENNLLNFMILIVKKYIYNCRCKEINLV